MNISPVSTYVFLAALYIIIQSLDRTLLMFYLMLPRVLKRQREKEHAQVHLQKSTSNL